MAGQEPDRAAVDPAERGDRKLCSASQATPADRAKGAGSRMTECGKGRRHEDEHGSSTTRAADAGNPMRGTGNEAPARTDGARPVSRSQMHAGAKPRSQSRISGHHQDKAARAAYPRQVPTECIAIRLTIVPQHDPCQAAGEARRSRARIGEPTGIGEQPQRREISPRSSGDAARPGD